MKIQELKSAYRKYQRRTKPHTIHEQTNLTKLVSAFDQLRNADNQNVLPGWVARENQILRG